MQERDALALGSLAVLAVVAASVAAFVARGAGRVLFVLVPPVSVVR
jgi:hypothetical protein